MSNRAIRRAAEAKIETRMERVARIWGWGPEYRKRHELLLKKLAHNPKACGGSCCNHSWDTKGHRKREQKEMREEIAS